MGAEVAWSADLCFLREFDLVAVGPGADCSGGSVFLRLIEIDRLRLRPVVLGAQAEVKTSAVVMPGCELGDGVVVEPLSVALEGSAAEAGTVWAGNPMRLAGEHATGDPEGPAWGLMLAKVACQGLLLYVLFYAGQLQLVALFERYPLPSDFRYTLLLFWVVSYFYSGLMQVLLCVGCKWVVVGRAAAGTLQVAACFAVCRWVVRYLARLAAFTFLRFLGDESFMANWWLLLLGAQLGKGVKCCNSCIADPCGADLVHIGDRSVLSNVTIRTEVSAGKDAKELAAAELGRDCAVGLRSVLGPGVSMPDCTTVGALTYAGDTELKSHTLYFGELAMGLSDELQLGTTRDDGGFDGVAMLLCRLGLFACLAATLVPSFELGQWLFYGSNTGADQSTSGAPLDRNLGLLLTAGPFLVGLLCWTLFGWLFGEVIFSPALQSRGPRFPRLYVTYQVAAYLPQSQLLPLWCGSALATVYLRLWGAHLDGTVYINIGAALEHPLLTVGSNSVIDQAYLVGHKQEGPRLLFGPNTVGEACVLQPSAITWAGDDTPGGTTLGACSKVITGSEVLQQSALESDQSLMLSGVPATVFVLG
jgi:acetyltransferase-like isoleucine patch superfamily enzyme